MYQELREYVPEKHWHEDPEGKRFPLEQLRAIIFLAKLKSVYFLDADPFVAYDQSDGSFETAVACYQNDVSEKVDRYNTTLRNLSSSCHFSFRKSDGEFDFHRINGAELQKLATFVINLSDFIKEEARNSELMKRKRNETESSVANFFF